MRASETPGFPEVYAAAQRDPEAFWAEAATAIDWTRPWQRVLDRSRPPFYRWFTGGELNTCHNAVDRHVAAGRGTDTALIYDSPVTGTIARYTFEQLRNEIARLAGALHALGVGRMQIYLQFEQVLTDAQLEVLRPLVRRRSQREPLAYVLGTAAFGAHADTEVDVAWTRLVNDWAHDTFKDHLDRFAPGISLPLGDIDASVKELERAAGLDVLQHGGLVAPHFLGAGDALLERHAEVGPEALGHLLRLAHHARGKLAADRVAADVGKRRVGQRADRVEGEIAP